MLLYWYLSIFHTPPVHSRYNHADNTFRRRLQTPGTEFRIFLALRFDDADASNINGIEALRQGDF